MRRCAWCVEFIELTHSRDCHQPQRDRDLGAETRTVAQHQTCHAVCGAGLLHHLTDKAGDVVPVAR